MLGQKKLDNEGLATLIFIAFVPLVIINALCLFYLFSDDFTMSPPLGWAASAAAAAVVIVALMQAPMLGKGSMKIYAISETGPRCILLAIVALLWSLSQLNLYSAMLAFALSFVCVIPICACSFGRPFSSRADLSLLPQMVAKGIVYALAAGAIMLQGRIGLLVLNNHLDTTAVGNFFAAQRASEIFLEIAGVAGLALFSKGVRDTDRRQSLFAAMRLSFILFAVFAIVGLIAMNFSGAITATILGNQYVEAGAALKVLLIGLGPASAVRVLNNVVGSLGAPWISLCVIAVSVLMNFLCCLLWVPAHGVTGAAWALVAGQTFAALLYAAVCYLMLSRLERFPD
jgi:O-antigen/teichoic acid export membrane protein